MIAGGGRAYRAAPSLRSFAILYSLRGAGIRAVFVSSFCHSVAMYIRYPVGGRRKVSAFSTMT